AARNLIDGETDTVDRDRTFARHVFRERVRNRNLEQPIVADRREALDDADAVDVAAHEMSAEPIREPQRFFKIDPQGTIEAGDARERFARNVYVERIPRLRNDRQANAVHRDAVADRHIIEREIACFDAQTYAAGSCFGAFDAANGG